MPYPVDQKQVIAIAPSDLFDLTDPDKVFREGTVLPSQVVDTQDDAELRIAFDFDSLIGDDASERVFKADSLARTGRKSP